MKALAIAVAAIVIPGTSVELRAQGRGLAILDEAAAKYSGVETLCADFVQRLSIPLLGAERTGSGRVCQARPNLFAMRFDDPEGDAIVVDGESAWLYYPSNDPKQVLKTPAQRSAGGHDFHREFLENPEVKYDVTYEAADEVGGTPTHRLRLIPKGRARYRAAVVWIDRGDPVLRRVRIEEENGNVRTITLSNVAFDAAPEEGWFMFTPPEGALVIIG